MKHPVLLTLILCLCLGAFALAEEATPTVPFNEGFYNPVMPHAADPWVIQGDGCYYWCYGAGSGVAITCSETLTGLAAAKELAANNKLVPALPAQTEIWAPELHHYQGHWYIFYAADYDNDNTLHRMYAVRSRTDDPLGDWEEPVKLELPEDQWAIDGTFFEYADGRIFFIWSGWRILSEGSSIWKQYLYISELEPGDPTKVKEGTKRVMISKPQYYWEMTELPQNEGPAVLVSPEGTYYCMYAGNYSKSNDYVVAAIRLNGDPMDAKAWEKLKKPILRSNEAMELYAPGHASFTKSPDGTEDWIIYHSAKASGSGWDRNGRAQKITWVDDTPTVPEGMIFNDEIIPLPSGEVVDRVQIQLEDGAQVGSPVLHEGLTTSAALTFPTYDDQVVITYDAPQDGIYAIYVRHNNATGGLGAVRVRLNDAASASLVTVRITGNEQQFILTPVLLGMKAGLNTITFTAQNGIALDLIIIDQTTMEK